VLVTIQSKTEVRGHLGASRLLKTSHAAWRSPIVGPLQRIAPDWCLMEVCQTMPAGAVLYSTPRHAVQDVQRRN